MIMSGTLASSRMSMRLDLFALATLSIGAAAIHFAVIGEHFAEYVLFGVFFSVVGWFEASSKYGRRCRISTSSSSYRRS